jgi:hypothetical protein
MPVIPHPPYTPDLAHCDFFLFDTTEEIQTESLSVLDTNSKRLPGSISKMETVGLLSTCRRELLQG